ncbi:glycine dehydrogenase (aminomethyl-transferring) [Capnocytophaga canis]|uniref:Glycine dehydrogenase (decarboxylating) n=1 Tax=Capnocytophaga canis TaxID=1848903 RepID=A0A3A1YLG6_9FLAO|nr:aminomethyl-transferring glycine dehydrogenase [Capnocytophaga canis]RIY38089.1 glycine dehydrogenase (aminomethyl-transferring) [Capnocytophaga canis]
MNTENFSIRHIGISKKDAAEMLQTIGAASLDQLIDQTIPKDIRLKSALNLPKGISEHHFLQHITELAQKNKIFKSYIGLGYHEALTPSVIKRNIFENPGWYTAYTPYQAEIAQGRLEALLNYQTVVIELTGMEIANASLLDEGTAAAEAMAMVFDLRSREQKKNNANKFFVSETVLPQTLSVLQTRANPFGIELVVGNHETITLDDTYFGAIVQYPATNNGEVFNYADFVNKAHDLGIKVVVAADLLSLVLLEAPAKFGADVVVGTSQRFGIPLGYGGPHAGYFATREEYKRSIPGRIIGITIDADGNPALRMALQTREQHIKRDKATSNICTAQVLLAVMAGMYAVYHGPKGLQFIAERIHQTAVTLKNSLEKLGVTVTTKTFFDTISIKADAQKVKAIAEKHEINFFYPNQDTVLISVNEATGVAELNQIITVFAEVVGKSVEGVTTLDTANAIPSDLVRTSEFLTAPVFNSYHSETDMMRYIKKLERKDLALNHSMISLGSCTMKLNAATEMLPLSMGQWANIHPFVPKNQALGYQEMLTELEKSLSIITGFEATSLQPNSGANGEYAGLMVIRQYHISNGQGHRNICLIPSSAHGTNPASAVMAGMEVVVTKTDAHGNIDVADLKEKAEKHKDNLAAVMITYPSTHGVFESSIVEIVNIIHENGGQVYLDGANMNAQVGLTNPGTIGADVCHLNLHKTFAIPHGGGGPGVGPICVAKHLAPFLPTNPIVSTGGNEAITAVSSAPYGSAYVCLISYAYIKMLGAEGLANATRYAILNANYLKENLKNYYEILYTGEQGRAAHEMILDCRPFKQNGIEATDIAKRLMDYGFHAPTVSFPVAGTLMVEPTESESKNELDRFISAMISIRREIEEATPTDEANVLKNAPHTLSMITADTWNLPYSRQKAAFPLEYIAENKFWPTVRRVNEAHGDRHLICSCAPIEAYM